MTPPTQPSTQPSTPLGGTQRMHPDEDRCFYCASDADIARARNGWEGRTVHMDTTDEQCPFWAPDDEEPS